jgi:amidase
MTQSKTWEDVAAAKQAARAAAIPAEWVIKVPDSANVMSVPATCGVLSPQEVEITETPASVLVQRLLARELSSEAVVTAFCKRAAIAQQLTNCLTEIWFDEAIAEARKIDEEYAATGTPRGSLHGLPVSLKDNVNVKGHDTTIGYIAYCDQPAADDALLAKAFRAAGAVLFCKTNVPTAMLMAETYNNVWGYTPNPYNSAYGAGGSSGGEGALVALRGTPLGTGTDIGGSIRIPCAVNGVYGLKPAAGRFPLLGGRPGLPGQEAIKSVIGPMTPDLAGLELWSKAVLEAKPWEADPAVYNLPWREVAVPEKLCFGMIMDDGAIAPTPAITRVLKETRAALEAAGHTVVEWKPYDITRALSLFMSLIKGDGGVTIASTIRGDIPEPFPAGLQHFDAAAEAATANPPTVKDLWKTQAARQAYLAEALAHWHASKEVTGTGRPFDGVIAPVAPYPAAKRYQFPIREGTYTFIWNLADQTSLVFPAGSVKSSDVGEIGREYRGADEKNAWENYDVAGLEGMPVGLQLVVPRHEEEMAIKLGGVIVDAIGKK